MRRKPRSTYHHGDLRGALLRAALELLDAEGTEAVTIRALARRAGVSHAAPANHFASRRELLTALATDQFRELGAAVTAALRAAPASPVERVRIFADTLIDFGLAAPSRYGLLWRRDLLDIDDPELKQAMDVIYDRLITELSAAAGSRPHDAHTHAVGLWSLVHGYLCMRIDGTFEPARDRVSGEPRQRAIVSAFLRALRPTAGRPSAGSSGPRPPLLPRPSR